MQPSKESQETEDCAVITVFHTVFFFFPLSLNISLNIDTLTADSNLGVH